MPLPSRKMSSPRRPVAAMLGLVTTVVTLSVSGGVLWSTRSPRFSCFLASAKLCAHLGMVPASAPGRVRVKERNTDGELASLVLSRHILRHGSSSMRSPRPKLAFMFLTRGPLPLARLWERFFQGHEGMYTIYVHASEEAHYETSPLFSGRRTRSMEVSWGNINMIDAERRLLTNALLDNDNEYFLLLSESCIPLRDFNYIYEYFMNATISFVDCFYDPGPHGMGRYLQGMKPEIEKEDFSKGAQWFAVNKQHALLLISDSLYYSKFERFCKRGDEFHNCYPDEHYVQTFLHIIDPGGISNWSVTHVDWKNQKWHPRSYKKKDISLELLREIQKIDESVHVSSDGKMQESRQPCIWNGIKRPCYLFARKFEADTVDYLDELFANFTALQ